MMGDKERAEKALQDRDLRASNATAKETTRLDFGSSLRDGAAIVTLVAETGIAKPETPRLVERHRQGLRLPRVYTSTQEQAWMMLAAIAVRPGQAGRY